MATLSKISHYYHRVRIDDEVNVKVSDILRINVTITIRYIHSTNNIERSTLLKRSMLISSQNFIKNNQNFLRSFMFDPCCSKYFIPEIVDVMSKEIVNKSMNILEFCCDPMSIDSEDPISLNLDIMLDIIPTLFLRMEKNCSICMEDFRYEESERLSSLSCDHVFHRQCIVKWLKIRHTCPLCRCPV
ncbi:E3 ubiquitin-protein ligase [Vigna unguiculata]|uniref:RING-type E3 ubiquitin transferase n=1 Tax=Vigna unguiculata TaxID=3917 RepID=A0A4D6NFS5_VIGUN|nr:E3 ubiquitin-protein ligase [Vigna unguiculata]